MNVLSLFDGMSGGRLALATAGITPTKYYASEVDKFAIKVSSNNWTDVKQLGCVTNWRNWPIDWSSIDLLIGGSPCQGFSLAGKQKAFNDPRSMLFFTYVDILIHIKQRNPNVRFMLENVKMKAEYLQTISDMLGVSWEFINSALVSAQNRQRYYWCNWSVTQPQDRGIVLNDILESEGLHVSRRNDKFFARTDGKSLCITASYGKGADNRGQRSLIAKKVVFNRRVKGVTEDDRNYRKTGISELGRILKQTATHTDALTCFAVPKITLSTLTPDGIYYRMLTPLECERLQTVPDGYTAGVSNTQRYKMLGNGWTNEVIVHLLKCLLTEVNNSG